MGTLLNYSFSLSERRCNSCSTALKVRRRQALTYCKLQQKVAKPARACLSIFKLRKMAVFLHSCCCNLILCFAPSTPSGSLHALARRSSAPLGSPPDLALHSSTPLGAFADSGASASHAILLHFRPCISLPATISSASGAKLLRPHFTFPFALACSFVSLSARFAMSSS